MDTLVGSLLPAYDVSMDLDQASASTASLNTSFNAMVSSDPALKGLTMENFFKFDDTDDDEMRQTSTSDALKEAAAKVVKDQNNAAAEEAQADADLGEFQTATDFFNTSGFLANLELPGNPGLVPIIPPVGMGMMGGLVPPMGMGSDLGAGVLDAMIAMERDTDSLIMPNYVQAGMASLNKSSVDVKPKRKYTKRKSGDNLMAGARTKKRSLSKHQSCPAGVSGAGSPKTPRAKGLTKHSSTPAAEGKEEALFDKNALKAGNKRSAATGEAIPKQTSSFRGVSCCGKDRKWQARIRDANRVRYLGRFGTEVEAAFVYDDAARSLKGERAPTNFVKLDAAQKNELVASFVSNSCQIPSSMMHYVVRQKAKGERSSSKSIRTIFTGVEDSFPDSPVAKVKNSGNSPAISPSVKSTPSRVTAFSKPLAPTRIDKSKAGATTDSLTPIPVSVLFHQ
jgi:hypothetical protein